MGKIIKTEYIDIDIDLLTINDMPNEILKEIYTLCGRDVAVSLMENFCGSFLTIPARPFDKIVRRIATEEFDGTTASIRNIARKYKIAEPVIRKLLKQSKIKNVPIEGQIGLFDKNEKQ